MRARKLKRLLGGARPTLTSFVYGPVSKYIVNSVPWTQAKKNVLNQSLIYCIESIDVIHH